VRENNNYFSFNIRSERRVGKMKGEKGITLVALIITIIVMLILLSVSVTILLESDLLGAAETASSKYKEEVEKESNLSEITVDSVKYNSIEEYAQSICNHEEFDDDNKCTNCGIRRIEFTIDLDNKSYYCIEGMTWEQWINSEYSPDFSAQEGFTVQSNETITGGGIRSFTVAEGTTFVKKSDKIKPITYSLLA